MRLTMPDAGRITLAKALVDNVSIFAVIGNGDPAWGASPPAIDPGDTELESPIAVLRPSSLQYVTPAPGVGAIETSDGNKWSVSGTPTKYVYAIFSLGYADAAGETIREFALYFDADLSSDPGQAYSDYATEVNDLGSLLGLKRFPPIVRTASLHDFGEILTF